MTIAKIGNRILSLSEGFRYVLFCLLLIGPGLCYSNMADPVQEGSQGSSPFASTNIDILNERLHIGINESFRKARFDASYNIYAHKSGQSIPIVFVAAGMVDSFSIRLNNETIEVLDTSWYHLGATDSLLQIFGLDDSTKARLNISAEDSATFGGRSDYNHLYYFELNLDSGFHTINARYQVWTWDNSWGPQRENSVRYVLWPARLWRSFGGLEVILDAHQFDYPIITNLGEPHVGSLDSIAVWNFDHIPVDLLYIDSRPELNQLANTLHNINIYAIASLVFGFLILIHLYFIYLNRKRHPVKPPRIDLLLCFLIPFLYLLLITSIDNLRAWSIDDLAVSPNDYDLFLWVFYPVLLVAYLLIAFIVDFMTKRYLNRG